MIEQPGDVLVTGANGFIGWAVWSHLHRRGRQQVWAGLRNLHRGDALGIPKQHRLELKLGESKHLPDVSRVEVIVHTAAQVPTLGRMDRDASQAMQRVNVDGTLALARHAAASGVRRFVFLSSIKVNGETTLDGAAFGPNDPPAPVDAYGESKWQAEVGLRTLAEQTSMEVVIIRMPLVYGPGVKGNVATLVNLVRAGVPLPLKSVQNRRSLVALDNLVDFVALCTDRARSALAANEVFVVSDTEEVSIGQLLDKMARAYGLRVRLWPMPVSLLGWATRLTGRQAVADRLLGSLVVDSSKTRQLLGWTPVVTMDEQLQKMANYATNS